MFVEKSFFLRSRVSAWIKENLPKAKDQGAESAEQHKRKHNDAKAHTGNQVYSCGSLAPKLKKGGCSDCEVCTLNENGTVGCVGWCLCHGVVTFFL